MHIVSHAVDRLSTSTAIPEACSTMRPFSSRTLKGDSMSHLLQPVFAQLWHSDPNVRLQTSVQLVAHLEEAQKSAVASSSDATTDNEDAVKHLEEGLAPEVSYALKRLIRGLASPRESSRIGFAVALTEVCISYTAKNFLPVLRRSSSLTDLTAIEHA